MTNQTFRYTVLVTLLLLPCLNLWYVPHLLEHPKPGRFINLNLAVMLLLNHVAFWWIPAGRMKQAAQIIACGWLVYAVVYMFTMGFTEVPKP